MPCASATSSLRFPTAPISKTTSAVINWTSTTSGLASKCRAMHRKPFRWLCARGRPRRWHSELHRHFGRPSLTGSFARSLADRFKEVSSRCRNIDGVVAIDHTEEGSGTRPNNLVFCFELWPASWCIPMSDHPGRRFWQRRGQQPDAPQYPGQTRLSGGQGAPRFLTWQGNYQAALDAGEAVVKAWLQPVNACQRTAQSVEHLRIALQCGGSDAFPASPAILWRAGWRKSWCATAEREPGGNR